MNITINNIINTLTIISVTIISNTELIIGNKLNAKEIIGKENVINRKQKYILGPGDRLKIKVYMLDRFDSTVNIFPDGTISLPRIGTLNIWGLNIDEASKFIKESYSKILKNPIIHIYQLY